MHQFPYDVFFFRSLILWSDHGQIMVLLAILDACESTFVTYVSFFFCYRCPMSTSALHAWKVQDLDPTASDGLLRKTSLTIRNRTFYVQLMRHFQTERFTGMSQCTHFQTKHQNTFQWLMALIFPLDIIIYCTCSYLVLI